MTREPTATIEQAVRGVLRGIADEVSEQWPSPASPAALDPSGLPPGGARPSPALPPALLGAVRKLSHTLTPESAKALAALFHAMADQTEQGRGATGVLTAEWARASDLILDNGDTDAPPVEGEEQQEAADQEAGTPEEPNTTPTAEDGPQDVPQDRAMGVPSEVDEEPFAESPLARARGRAVAKSVIKVAQSQLGYHEGSNNNTKYGRWYRLNHQPWCAMFVSWVAAKAGAGKAIPKFAYCPSGAAWFRKRRRWGQKPKVGAIVFYNYTGRIDHVGIVEAIRKGGSIVTIEGNTDDAVRRRVRRTRIVGYGYPAYS